MIEAILIDDEINSINNLKSILIKHFTNDVCIIETALSVDEALPKIKTHSPQLIFLDIEMPNKNGFDLLKKLNSYDFEIVFVTAYSTYGIDAIKFSALDYILKPIDEHDLKKAIEKAKFRIKEKQLNASLENLIEYIKNEKEIAKHKIAIASIKETRFVLVNEIMHCESQNSYTIFHLVNDETIVSSTALYEYELLLEKYHFIRCHQSHLVNNLFIKSITKNNGDFLKLTNGTEIPISRQKKEAVKQKLLE